MAARNFLPRYLAFELQIFKDSIGIRLKKAVYLGKNFLAAILAQSSIDNDVLQNLSLLEIK